jgi:hypothetical protein
MEKSKKTIILWIDLTRDRDWWMALVNTVMNLRVLEQLHDWRVLKKGSAP